MPEKNNNIKIKLSEVLKYLKGDMSGKEKNSFEKELQKDPFAEEAMDGLSSIAPDRISEDIRHLNTLVKRKIRKKQWYILYRIAASVAILMIISSVFIVVERNNTGKKLSIEAPVVMEVEKRDPLIKINEEPNTLQKSGRKEETGSFSKLDEPAVVPDEMDDKKLSPERTGRFSGHVIDPNDVGEEIELVPPGFEKKASAKGRAATYDENKIDPAGIDMPVATQLIPEKEADRNISETDIEDASGYSAPVPAGGMDQFYSYIEENLTRLDSATTGQRIVVVAGFIVKHNGTIDSINIIRSPGRQFSEEAIRLIRSGPLWIPAKKGGIAIDDKVRVRIVFK
jgi:hypothetical protein